MTIHEKIRQLRMAKNMTLEEVGKIVGVGKSTVRKWESGEIANMRRDKIAKLANALGTTPSYLMGWSEEIGLKVEECTFSVSPHEKRLLLAYRAKPELQAAVDKLLDIEAEVVNAPSRAGTA